LQHAQNVLFDTEFTKNGSFLRQIADAVLRPLVHGKFGDVGAIQKNLSPVGFYQAYDHVKGGRFSGAIGTQQTDDLSLIDFQRNPFYHLPATVGLHDIFGSEFHLKKFKFKRKFKIKKVFGAIGLGKKLRI
jgi:hypothetical protein